MDTTRNPNRDLQQQRQRLEALVQPTLGARIDSSPSHNGPIYSGLGRAIKQLGDKTMRFFTGQNELRIWQRSRNGQPLWFAHDPVTNRTRSFYSEQDVRTWLDQRYYE
ncbi:hypothetical protein [Nodosilinea nodulosa]|uniref:hypothetical protein n=1 Tax=Nodosilinea nodulosa TaxID=416001 RepID=UPI000314D513|nr:hypothetical protein [Nodosilinea nodulosa]